MRIILATGIYLPQIGGPATYVENLARELAIKGEEVTVVTFDRGEGIEESSVQSNKGKEGKEGMEVLWNVVRIGNTGGPLLRWRRYAAALRRVAGKADIVYGFSSVSVGMPLKLARLKRPKKILRLGGDFLWERYTDCGGTKPLREFYASYPGLRPVLRWLLKAFDSLVFSTSFQQDLCRRLSRALPPQTVIENALPAPLSPHPPSPDGGGGFRDVDLPALHAAHDPFRLLFLGRFVRFKNLFNLIRAAGLLPHVRLTLAGEGPLQGKLQAFAEMLGLGGRITFLLPVRGEEKRRLFLEQDALILPSLTEISPHAAVEARGAGLPVLLTEETGLSGRLIEGMLVRELRKASDITRAVLELEQNYAEWAAAAASPFSAKRTWTEVCEEHLILFRQLLST